MVLQFELPSQTPASGVSVGESSAEALNQRYVDQEDDSFLQMVQRNEYQDSEIAVGLRRNLDLNDSLFETQLREHDAWHDDSEYAEPYDPGSEELELQSECDGASEAYSLVTDVAANNSCPEGVSAETDELSVDDINIDACVAGALQSLPLSIPKPIWEQGVWAAVFGSGLLMELKHFEPEFHRPAYVFETGSWVDEVLGSEPKLKRPRQCDHLDSFGDVVKHVTDIAWEEERESILQKALKRWLVVIGTFDRGSNIFQQLDEATQDSDKVNILGDYFRGKAPSTLLKRVRAVEKICQFLGPHVFPCGENAMYRFFTAERAKGAPLSRLKGYLEAAAFCYHVFSMGCLKDVICSKRLHGATFAEMPVEVQQSSPLRVDELLKLHGLVENETSWNSLFAGSVLFAVYARARWADMQHSCKLNSDRDFLGVTMYLEATTAVHKTMHADMFRHRFLPLVAPALGVSDKPWVDRWLEIRRQLGVTCTCCDAGSRGGWMPLRKTLDSHGSCGACLRKLLSGSPEQDRERRITAHSMKSTTLSYAAKFGLSAETRLQLGYHVAGFKILHTYSRDSAAQPLMELQKVLESIRDKSFMPDETRSGRFRQATGVTVEVRETTAVPVIEIESKEEEGRESELDVKGSELVDSSSSSDSSEEEFPERVPKRTFPPPTPPAGYIFWQHRKLKTLHLTKPDFVRVFMCSRNIGPNYTKEDMSIRYDTPVCRGCANAVRVME